MGPMVLAGFIASEEEDKALRELGVKDSKAFGSGPKAREKRAALAAELKKLGRWEIRKAEAAAIEGTKLNDLAYLWAKEIVGKLGKGASVVTDGGEFFERMKKDHPDVTVITGGDRKNVFVAAASILAKDERDTRYAEMISAQRQEIEGLMGDEEDVFERILDCSSYPSSKLFKEYLKRYHARHGKFPPETRTRMVHL